MAKIVVSFKDKEKDLYDHVKKQLSESVYIKQLILNDMNFSSRDQIKQPAKTNSLIDF